ncbi:MAG: hypothetical protein JXB48_24145 [Candidatus Latescibacteria bacterium]|nr:hypothetical protein [Candidatus Latescibacterota bacterium]
MAINKPEHDIREEPPPIFSTWKRLYLCVLLNLVILIVLFYAFTRFFA